MKKHLFIAAAAVVALASCTTSDEFFDPAQETAQQELNDNAIRFGTYMGNQVMTRAAYEGTMNTDVLKDNTKGNGFGVFAYYTGTGTYGAYQKAGTTTLYPSESSTVPSFLSPYYANFMYNQHVTWNTTTKLWEYTPIKYWPNEFDNSDVDDQEKDANDNTAWGSNNGTLTNGGNVSFFAYAPWTEVSAGGAPTGSPTDGITAVTANNATGDPIITYKLATDGEVVDLLWGTMSGTNTNVNNAGNTGVTGTSTAPYPQGASFYSEEVLAPYTTNADLTKQRTDGKVGFAFKHALAKVGGSNIPGASGSTVNGLMIVLDIDKNGKESGGTRESWTSSSTDDSWRTIVTVKSITITNDLDGDENISASGSKGDEQIVAGGQFNLATGKWTAEAKSNTKYIHSITKDASTSVEGSKAAVLSTAIVENGGPTPSSEAAFFLKTNAKTGVTETPQNVYGTEANPLVFIPGTTPTLRFTIDYVVRTYDANLAKKYSEVEQVISKKVTFNDLQLNKQYSMLIHLGLTGIKFTALVSDWSVAGDDNNNGVIDGTESLKVEDVYLPINVSSLLVSYSAGPTTKFASTAASANVFTVSSAKYYEGDVEQAVALSSLAYTVTPAASWLTEGITTTVNAANTTFATRSTTVTITKAPYICEEPVTITQFGRIPSDDATLTLTTGSFATLDKTAHPTETYNVTAASIDKYYETDATGAKTGSELSGTVSLTGGTDIDFSKAIFVDNAGKPVNWITPTDGGFSVFANGTGVARTATVAYIINGKVVKSNKTVTQNP